MSKFLVLGGGNQGSMVAKMLAESGDNVVTLADFDKKILPPHKKVQTQFFDAKDVKGSYRNVLGEWFANHDVVVGCLPSHLGADCVGLAAEYGANYIDLSFTNEDLFQYNELAMHSKCTIITDCGLAPGLPNLLVGNLLGELTQPGEKLPPLSIYVGGVSLDAKVPMGYVETWSLEDLYEEYVRPGRFVENGLDMVVNPLDLNRLKALDINGRKYEAFTSDGLRSLLRFKQVIPNMREFTLRYPGHMKEVNRMLRETSLEDRIVMRKDDFVRVFRSKLERGLDKVVLMVDCGDSSRQLVVKGTPELSAMAKTTACTCGVMAYFLSEESDEDYCKTFNKRPAIDYGVLSMETIGANPVYFGKILAGLDNCNVTIQGIEQNHLKF